MRGEPLPPEFEHAPGDSEGHGSLVCCSPWGCTESDMTEHPGNTGSYSEDRGALGREGQPMPVVHGEKGLVKPGT